MAGIQDTNVVDLVTHDSSTGEYALIMVEERPWEDSKEQLAQLREKINNYSMFVLDEGLISAYPEAAGKPLRLQLDCTAAPSIRVAELINLAAEQLKEHGIRFVVNVLK